MGIQRKFFLKEDEKGLGLDTNIVESAALGARPMRVFPVDNYEFPEEIKRQAREWHVLKVPLLGQQVLSDEQEPDWCGRTSASMIYNYFQLIKGGDPRSHYITHSRAGDPECLLDLRFPGGERAFFGPPFEPALPKNGWAAHPEHPRYEIQSSYSSYFASDEGELPVPLSQLFPHPENRPKGVGGVLRYRTPSNSKEPLGHLLPDALRHEADDIKNSEERTRGRFEHIISCLRANNPVLIYTGIGLRNPKKNTDPRHIIVICGYCILELGGVKQLWLVTADPSTKFELAKTLLPAPNGKAGGRVDLGHQLEPHHALFRMRSGILSNVHNLKGFASFNLVRATAFFEKNPETLKTEFNRFLDHSDEHCGRYAYREKRTEAPPEVVDSSFSRPKYSFPLRGNAASSHPWQCYYNNESLDTGIGGYYVLGLQRNLHGGVHFFPPSQLEMAPVSAVAPGYVVAARLPAEGSSSLAPGVAEALGNWPGFVLLRHELEELPQKNASSAVGRRGTVYTLYMHLRSPVYPAANAPKQTRGEALDRYFREVPWFQKLYQQRFGAWVSISETAEAPPGTLRWSAGPVSDEDARLPEAGARTGPKQYGVLGENGAPDTSILVRTDKGQEQWLYKAPPGNLRAAMQALADGKVVTFDEPFFPVTTGEVLGFAGPLPGEQATSPVNFQVPRDPDVPGRRMQFTLRSGFLHFQVFCPEQDQENGIQLLMELAKQLDLGGANPLEFADVEEAREDNFLEVAQVQNHLEKALPPEDRELFHKETGKIFAAAEAIPRSSREYAAKVASLLDKNTSFAPEAEKPDWSSPCCRFAYPLKLEVETLYLPKPEQNSMVTGGSYELELCFEQEVAGEWLRMECPQGGCGGEENGRKVCKPAVLKIDGNKLGAAKKGVVPLSLKVPALAERMTLKARGGFFIDQTLSLPPGADGRLLAEGITRRWRNVHLRQKNEWTSANVKAVLEKVNAMVGAATDEAALKTVLEIAWCDPVKEAHIARIPALGDAKPSAPGAKHFKSDGWLAPERRLENLHPVTAVWLLNVLDKQRKARVRDDWSAPSFRQEDPRPLCAGWVVRKGAPIVGDSLTAVVIDEDFGYDKQNRVTLLARQDAQELVLAGGREFGPGGNIVQSVPAGFWGPWSLVVADTSEPPKALEPKAQPAFLAKTVSIPRPKLLGEQTPGEAVLTERPQRQADGSWRWRIPFEAGAPRELAAFLLLRTDTREAGPGSPYPERVLPITVRSLVDTKVPDINRSRFVLGPEGQEDFIIGLTPDGQTALAKKDLILYVIESHVRYKHCLDAMDIQVGWGLVKGLSRLAAKKVPFTLLHLSADGRTCTLQSKADLERFKEVGARTVTMSFTGDITLEFDPMVCDDPKPSAAWVFDAERRHVLNCSPAARGAPLGSRKYSEFQAVYRKDHGVRLHVRLAAALWHVEKALGKTPLVIERIELSGMSCVIDASGKGAVDRVRAAAASGGFEVTEADPARKSRLRLTANPAAKNLAVASFHPGRIFDSLNQSELPPGQELFYWFELVALNGQSFLHRSPGENTGEGDGSLTLAALEALKARTSEPIRATHEGPGRYRKVALRDLVTATDKEPARQLTFKPAPRLGQCELELAACVRGAPEDLNRYTATFSRKAAKAKKWEPLKGFTKLRPEKLDLQGDNSVAEWRVVARVPYPQAPVEGDTEFKLELVSDSVDCEPRQLEATGTYDFKPRWEGPLKVEQKGELLELRCHGEGLEVPLPGSKDARAWNVAREFEVVIEPDKADPHLEGLKPKLSEHLRYATPKPDGKRGGCDAEGDFVATLDLKALEPGVAYTFTLRRANNSPVRQTVMPPVKSDPFTRTRDEE